jgi:hypothetical protein
MNETLRKAYQSLLEGDRDGSLKYLSNESPTPDVIWLRAHSVNSDEERKQLLYDLSNSDSSIYSRLASAILAREHGYDEQLEQPPDYQFWKQTTWKKRREKLKEYRFWFFGACLMVFLAITGILFSVRQNRQTEQEIVTIQLTQTAVAFLNQTVANYPTGILRILNVENPTNRTVTFDQPLSTNNPSIATPAAGSRFAAMQLQFTCNKSICSNPPEASLALLLKNGQSVSYDSSSSPALIGETPMARIASGKTTQGWFVFEVPQNSSPEALLVFYGDATTPQRINWPKP